MIATGRKATKVRKQQTKTHLKRFIDTIVIHERMCQSKRSGFVIKKALVGKFTSPLNPKMIHLVGSTSFTNLATIYFGSLDFLDLQDIFDSVFGKSPLIVGIKSASENNLNCMSRVRQYAEKCMLGVFLDIYRANYVESYNIIDRKTSCMKYVRQPWSSRESPIE